jgi:hypothetical protein
VGLLANPTNPQPAAFTWQLLGKLQYLQAVIREGLRLFSPAANGSFRLNTTGDLKLKEGLVIPKVSSQCQRSFRCRLANYFDVSGHSTGSEADGGAGQSQGMQIQFHVLNVQSVWPTCLLWAR